MGAIRLVHDDPCTCCTVQQPLEVKAGELVLSVLADMRRKGRHRTGIARFEFGKCLQIGCRIGILILLKPERLEGAQSFSPAPQDKVPDRPPAELRHSRREGCANANAGAELLIDGFQP